jgi:hypothetical protein
MEHRFAHGIKVGEEEEGKGREKKICWVVRMA